MILLPRSNRGHNKGKGCDPCGRSRRSHLLNISMVLSLVFGACYLSTTQAVSDSTNHLLKGPAARTTLSRTMSEDDSPPAAFIGSITAAGDTSSSSSATIGPNAGFLSGGEEDQHQHLDAEFPPAPLIQADSPVNVHGKDDVSINDKVRNHDHE